jgi:hypothetical protein
VPKSAAVEQKRVYGLDWPIETDELDIEKWFVQQGGYFWCAGRRYGLGKYYHMKQMQSLLWPDDDHHRWSDLMLKRKCENEILVMMGSADSNKTYSSARYVLCDWWANVDNTLWMVSSTELRGAELRIWGKLKELFNRAKERYPDLPGTILESRTCITTEVIDRQGEQARVLTKGIIFIPCKSGENWVGLGAYAGIKPTKNGRLGHCGDEVSFMEISFLQAYANWFGKPNFQGILDGNPIELDDPLCTAAEPEDGWDSFNDTKKTQEWRSKWYGAWVIAYDGRDSPNFDYPPDQPPRYPYMINNKKIDAVAKVEGLDSALYWMQCVGKPLPGSELLRVFTLQDCEKFGAYKPCIWSGGEQTDIIGLDAAYSGEGGDRCALEWLRFGREVGGQNVIEFHKPEVIPVNVKMVEKPDVQIARWVMNYCVARGIPPENVYFDGRALLALAFANVWSAAVNVIDFGGPATPRPVSNTHTIYDEKLKVSRLKRCDEHYVKFVTELWYAFAYILRGKQARNFDKDTADEGSKRRWMPAKSGTGTLIEIETKKDMKLRTRRSPDLMDAHVTAIEGARRRGFQIENIREPSAISEDDWLQKALDKWNQQRRKHELNYRT